MILLYSGLAFLLKHSMRRSDASRAIWEDRMKSKSKPNEKIHISSALMLNHTIERKLIPKVVWPINMIRVVFFCHLVRFGFFFWLASQLICVFWLDWLVWIRLIPPIISNFYFLCVFAYPLLCRFDNKKICIKLVDGTRCSWISIMFALHPN